ncbi:MAG: ATP-binding protein, partial [Verrucomicrobiota bacterium]
MSRTPRENLPEAVVSCPSGSVSHHSTGDLGPRDPGDSPELEFPALELEGDRHHWLCRIRDFIGAKSATLATIHSQASGSRDPYSSLDSPWIVKELVKKALGEVELDPFSSQASSQWIPRNEDSPLFVSVIPAPEAERASLVILELDETGDLHSSEKLGLYSRLTAREARLVQEAERRISAEEMFYHSQKLNCMGQLAGGIAHDFNNLLTVIQGHTGFVELAAQRWNDPKVLESIELIQNATLQSVGLVKQLLLFSRDQKASFEVLDLNTVVDDFSKMVRRMVEETISLKVELDSEAGHIRADKGMLSQILMNLIVNARDAMPNGGEIIVETAQRAEEDEKQPFGVSLIISDTGCGIAGDKLGRIFDPFYTTKPKGTGLGLANVAGLVRQHSGIIDISSELGVGTRVEIHFPSATCRPEEPPALELTDGPAAEKSICGSKV